MAGVLTWCTCAVTLTDAALAAAVAAEAGELLLAMREQVGYGDVYDPYGLGDAGDKRANALIVDRLHKERPHDSVLSEEAVDDLSRVNADRVWIVDPVDGTHEYSMPGRADWAVPGQAAGGGGSSGSYRPLSVVPPRSTVVSSDTARSKSLGRSPTMVPRARS